MPKINNMNRLKGIESVFICLISFLGLAASTPPAPTPEEVRFFESQVRPLLAENCFKCHGVDKAKDGLRLDSLSAMMAGGDSGEVIVPGKPEESRLIHAVRGEKGLEAMPPDDPLAESEIADLVTEMELVKHPFRSGIKAQIGVEF